MKWAILIPTIPARVCLFGELSARIANQIIHRSDVIGIVHSAEPTPDVAGIRNSLLDQARHAGAEYFSFIDDDDLVSLDYVRSILPLLDGVDTVQFNTAYYARGIFRWIEERGLQYHGVLGIFGRRALSTWPALLILTQTPCIWRVALQKLSCKHPRD